MSVNIQQADKTLKKVADTTVVNKSTVTTALGYTPVTPEQLSTTKTELTNSINTTKTELNSSISTLRTDFENVDDNLKQQIYALEGSSFDGDYNKLKNTPILNDADGTATFADETGNIIARIDNNGFETTNLNLHGDIELADEKLEIIDETGNIVLRIDNNGIETKTTNELKKQLSDIDAQADNNTSNIEQIQKDLEVFDFGDEGGLTVTDEQGNIIAKFDVETDAEGNVTQTGLITTDVTFEYEEDKTKTLTALNAEVAANAAAIQKNIDDIGDNADAIATKAAINSPVLTGTPEAPTPATGAKETQIATVGYVTTAVSEVAQDIADLPFEFNDDGALTIADEGGNILAQFAVEEDAGGNVVQTGLRVTDVTIGEEGTEVSVTKKFNDTDAAIANKMNKASNVVKDNIALFTDDDNLQDSGKKIVTDIDDNNVPTGAAIKAYVTDYDTNTIQATYATKESLNTTVNDINQALNQKFDKSTVENIDFETGVEKENFIIADKNGYKVAEFDELGLTVTNVLINNSNHEGETVSFNLINTIENKVDKDTLNNYYTSTQVNVIKNDLNDAIATKAPIQNPVFTGTPKIGEEVIATQNYVNTQIADADHLKRVIVETLPTSDIDERAIYMVKAASTETSTQDIYDEYMYINNTWERLGSWQTDLADYAKKTDITDLQIFKTVKVGDINVEADSNADTLTLVAGDNVTITADAENDKITISSTNTGFTTIGVEGEGNAITNVTPKNKVLTFTKGETFATKAEHDGFINEFNNNFNLNLGEGSLEIVDDPEKTSSNTQNILARFDNEGLRTTAIKTTNITLSPEDMDIALIPNFSADLILGTGQSNKTAGIHFESSFENNKVLLKNIENPKDDSDAATKGYVDEAIAGSGSSGIYIQATEPENPKDGDLWVDTDDEDGDVLATVATSGSFNDLTDKPTYGIADITNLQTELNKFATQTWVQQQIEAIAIYDGSVS